MRIRRAPSPWQASDTQTPPPPELRHSSLSVGALCPWRNGQCCCDESSDSVFPWDHLVNPKDQSTALAAVLKVGELDA
jgi:hypothetical protein